MSKNIYNRINRLEHNLSELKEEAANKIRAKINDTKAILADLQAELGRLSPEPEPIRIMARDKHLTALRAELANLTDGARLGYLAAKMNIHASNLSILLKGYIRDGHIVKTGKLFYLPANINL